MQWYLIKYHSSVVDIHKSLFHISNVISFLFIIVFGKEGQMKHVFLFSKNQLYHFLFLYFY